MGRQDKLTLNFSTSSSCKREAWTLKRDSKVQKWKKGRKWWWQDIQMEYNFRVDIVTALLEKCSCHFYTMFVDFFFSDLCKTQADCHKINEYFKIKLWIMRCRWTVTASLFCLCFVSQQRVMSFLLPKPKLEVCVKKN